jgi:hypothetical protein
MVDPLRIEIRVPTEWSRIEPVRSAVARCVSAAMRDRDLEVSLAMIASELLENAVKYGRPGSTVALTLRIARGRAVISVENDVEEGSAHVDTLRRHLDWLKGFSRASDAYVAALRRVYGGGKDSGGLGIARIVYEGSAEIECDTARPGRVVVKVECPLGERAA